MGTTFIIMTTLKLAAMGSVGIGLTTAFQFFHNFELRNKKGKNGGEEDGSVKSLREEARRIG